MHLARQFHAEGNEVSLVTFRPGGALSDELGLSGICQKSLQPLDTSLNFLAPGLLRTIDRDRPDVILCMGRMANCYAGLLQMLFPRIAVVGSVRTGKSLPAMNKWSLRRVSGVITNTDWWRYRLVELGIDPGKIAVVANGLTRSWSLADQAAARDSARKAMGLAESTVVFLNVAEFRNGKRHARLIEFFSTLESDWDWRLWLVGQGREWQRCRDLADRLGSDRICLAGHAHDPFAWYSAADVAVSASSEDALPNFLVEAQSLGLPVIATEFQGVCEAFQHGETGYLVPSSDPRVFREAVEELYLDTARRQWMSQRAKAFAAERFCSNLQGVKALDALKSFRLSHLGLAGSYA